MGSITISNKILDKYFEYLKFLDNKTKKRLIDKLNKSMETKTEKKFNPESIFGAWVDTRSSDEIISDIKTSRVEKFNLESLE